MEVVIEKNRGKAIFVLFLAILGVGSAAILVRFARSSAITIAFWRVLLAGGIAIVIGLASEQDVVHSIQGLWREKMKVAIAGSSLAFHFWLWFESLRHIPVAVNIVLVDTTPIWLALISFFILKIPLSKKEVLGIMIAIFGVAFFTVRPEAIIPLQGGNSLLGVFLALSSSWIVTVYLLVGRDMLQRHGLWMYFGAVNLMAAFTLLLVSIIFRYSLRWASSTDFWLLLALALGPSIVGHAGFNYSIRTLKPTTVGLAVLGETVIATVLSMLLLHEVPSRSSLIGAITIVLGITFAVLEEAKHGEKTKRKTLELSSAEI